MTTPRAARASRPAGTVGRARVDRRALADAAMACSFAVASPGAGRGVPLGAACAGLVGATHVGPVAAGACGDGARPAPCSSILCPSLGAALSATGVPRRRRAASRVAR